MRIVIDLQGGQTESRFRGIGYYSRALALAIARNAGKHEIWLALNGGFPDSISEIREAFNGLIPRDRIRVFDVPTPVAERNAGNAWRVRAAEKIRECFIQQLQPDVVLVTSLFEGYADDAVTSIGAFCGGVKTAVVLYDLIPLLNSDQYLLGRVQNQYYHRKIKSLKNAGMLLAISDYSRSEAIDVLGFQSECVVNISASVGGHVKPKSLSSQEAVAVRQRYGISREMILCVPGGFDARKNLDNLIRAYSLLPTKLRTAHQLIIVGKLRKEIRDRLEKVRKEAGLAVDELVLTDFVPDEDLAALYTEAVLFVFPSKHEGFGLPVLEAMTCGCPVVGSASTSIPEVIGLPDSLFDPLSPKSISDKMVQVLCDDALRERLRIHGLNRAKNFSWDESARRALRALEGFFDRQSITDSFEASGAYSALVRSIADIKGVGAAREIDLVKIADCLAFNSGRGGRRQLMLDISVLVQVDAKSGIQRVVRSILKELLECPPINVDVKPIYFDGAHYRCASAFVASSMGGGKDVDEIVDFCQDDIYLSLDLNTHLTLPVRDLHSSLQSRGVLFYFIVYDILLLQRPDWWPEGTSVNFNAWLRGISEVATGLVCISESVADDVRSWMKNNPLSRRDSPEICSFHLGADVESSLPTKGLPEDAHAVLGMLNAKPSFLMVGTVEPRKGHSQVLAAFEQLWSQGVEANLVIVGKQGWMVEALARKLDTHPLLGERLFWLAGISDEYLEKVYTASTCLIAASEGEGFGLPLIEAAQHQLPIIARDISVFREVAGEHAYYFSGLEARNLALAVQRWLELYEQGEAPTSVNMPWLTWKQSSQQLLKVIFPEGEGAVDIKANY